MKSRFLTILFTILTVFYCHGQFDLIQPVSESGYGMVKTNITVGYDHAFGAVPDNITGRVSYQIINKPYLKFSANARLNTLWSNFEDSRLSEPVDAWGIGLNGNHSYGSFGFTALGFLPLFGHPVAVLGIGNAEWSNHCFGRISGLLGAVYLFKVTQETQFGVGPIFILHTSSKIPVFPGIVYRHRFTPQFAINIYGGLFGLEYKISDKDLLVFGGDLDVRSFYFKPHMEGWPDKCRFTMPQFRPALKYKRSLARNFYGEVQAGVGVKLSGRITAATKSKSYLDFDEDPAFFLKATLSYSL